VDLLTYFAKEIEVAETAVRKAGGTIMGFFESDYRIEEKGKGNPVTTADLEANAQIREIILGHFPRDGWLSEEDKDNRKRLDRSRVWIVDPIDGTKEFIAGVPQFAVSIGFVVEGEPQLGVVYNPAEERLYRAVKGWGASLNGRPIQVSSRAELQGASLLVSRSEPRRKFQSFEAICRLEPIGSIACRLAKVAGGDGDGTLTFRSLHEWDVCAGVLIVQEAGGVVVDGKGRPLIFNRQDTRYHGIVASNEVLAWKLQEMLARILFEKS
jgi:myo-inositol-1(or 4)-monophosphatase